MELMLIRYVLYLEAFVSQGQSEVVRIGFNLSGHWEVCVLSLTTFFSFLCVLLDCSFVPLASLFFETLALLLMTSHRFRLGLLQ